MTEQSQVHRMKPRKLGEALINGRSVSFFSPPHNEVDLPWVDVLELARAFLPTGAAKRMTQHSQDFTPGRRATVTAQNGSRIATIMCHGMAQGLTGAIDNWNGCEDDGGPAFRAYCHAAGEFAAEHWPLSFEDMCAAAMNTGGPFMREYQTRNKGDQP